MTDTPNAVDHPAGTPETSTVPAAPPERRLRLQHVVVQPVLVWDDGEELHAGPNVQAVTLALSQIPGWAAAIPAEVARIAAEVAEGAGGSATS